MNKTMNLVLTLFVSLGIFLGCTWYGKLITTPDTQHKNESVQTYKTTLQQEEQQLWQQIATQHGFSKNVIYDKANELRDSYKAKMLEGQAYYEQNFPKPTKETLQIIDTLLALNNLDASKIGIVTWDIPVEAACNEYTIFINQKMLSKLSPESQSFVIAHELQHMIHEDCLVREAFEALISDYNKLPFDDPINKMNRFQEQRADICAGLLNETCATGGVMFMKDVLQEDQDAPDVKHPQTSIRIAQLQELTKLHIATA